MGSWQSAESQQGASSRGNQGVDESILQILDSSCSVQRHSLARTLLPWVLQNLEESTSADIRAATVPANPAQDQSAPDDGNHTEEFELLSASFVGLNTKGQNLLPVIKVDNIQGVIDNINKARQDNQTVRVAGSQHSVRRAISDPGVMTLSLSGELREVELLQEAVEDGRKVAYVRIGAGCYLGRAPQDPESTEANSACELVNKLGYAFPVLGGISHQSVAGFLMTGSSGGSLKHGFADAVREIVFVDGLGAVRVARPDTDMWRAVGVSMGLFGVITHVTFRLTEQFLVKGVERNVRFADSGLGRRESQGGEGGVRGKEGDEREGGEGGKGGGSRVQENLQKYEYFHTTWFAQPYVGRVMEWIGERTTTGDISPYHHVLEKRLAAIAAANVLHITNWIQTRRHPSDLAYHVMAVFLDAFTPLDHSQTFCDLWHRTLPNDNQAPTDSIISVDFTEIWIPVSQSQRVMDTLQHMFDQNPKSAGSFAVEIYGGKKSPFWMSMSYESDVIRVDPYWWHWNFGDKREYYAYFWDALLAIPGARLHWGKWLPLPGQRCGDVTFGPEWLRQAYPRFGDWMKLRAEMDPHQVFVSGYWREVLGIEEGGVAVIKSKPRNEKGYLKKDVHVNFHEL